MLRTTMPYRSVAALAAVLALSGCVPGVVTGPGGESGGSASTTAITGARRVRVVLFKWQQAEPSQPYSTAEAKSIVFDAADSWNALWRTESGNRVSLTNAGITAETLPATWTGPNGDVSFSPSQCNSYDWNAYFMQKYPRGGYEHLILVSPPINTCTPAGVGGWGEVGSVTAPGKSIWIIGEHLTTQILAHEGAHNFGLQHGNALDCTFDGTRVSLGGNCADRLAPDNFAQDAFDVMGWGRCTYGAENRRHLGWPADIETVSTSRTVSLRASDVAADGTPHALRIARPDDGFGPWLQVEWHTEGFPGCRDRKEGTANGLIVRLVPDTGLPAETHQLDMTPGTLDFHDGVLGVQQTFTDPATGVVIKLDALGAQSASVGVTFPPAPPATGGRAEVVGGVLRYTARAGEANNVQVTQDATKISVGDVVNVTPGAGCARFSDRTVHCPIVGITAVVVDAADGNDAIRTRTTVKTKVLGGAGDDVFHADASVDGPTIYKGGAGNDRVDYSSRTVAVTVKLDAKATDGQTGEGDLVKKDVEEIVGGAGNDTLIGDARANSLDGSLGNDVIEGRGGADTIIGSWGNDDLRARDGIVDTRVDCGAGTDTAAVDSGDPRTACESVT